MSEGGEGEMCTCWICVHDQSLARKFPSLSYSQLRDLRSSELLFGRHDRNKRRRKLAHTKDFLLIYSCDYFTWNELPIVMGKCSTPIVLWKFVIMFIARQGNKSHSMQRTSRLREALIVLLNCMLWQVIASSSSSEIVVTKLQANQNRNGFAYIFNNSTFLLFYDSCKTHVSKWN